MDQRIRELIPKQWPAHIQLSALENYCALCVSNPRRAGIYCKRCAHVIEQVVSDDLAARKQAAEDAELEALALEMPVLTRQSAYRVDRADNLEEDNRFADLRVTQLEKQLAESLEQHKRELDDLQAYYELKMADLENKISTEYNEMRRFAAEQLNALAELKERTDTQDETSKKILRIKELEAQIKAKKKESIESSARQKIERLHSGKPCVKPVRTSQRTTKG